MKQSVFTRKLGATAALLVALACTATLLPVQALEVAGVNFKPQTLVKGTKLQLNGAGVRQEADKPLYTAGLYLEKKAETAQEALQARGPKQVRVVMLREVNSRDFRGCRLVGAFQMIL